jgi:subtilisin family serine protease
MLVNGTDTILYTCAIEAAHPANDRPYIRLRIRQPYSNRAILMKATAPEGRVHFYNTTHLANDVGNWGQDFQGTLPDWTAGNPEYGIGDPASTESAITVAAYRAEYYSPGGTELGGDPAAFTTLGPTLDERMKPDIAAPGVSVASSISSVTDNNYSTYLEVDFEGVTYPFAKFSGTSMSSPTVAGIAALLLEADPTLSPAEVREILTNTARTDDETGELPPEGSTLWGHGKVHAWRAVAEVLGVNGVPVVAVPGCVLAPNPAQETLHVFRAEPGPWRIMNLQGQILQQATSQERTLTLSIAELPAGLYLFDTAGSNALRFVKN